MNRITKLSDKCFLEFEIIKTSKGKKLRSRFLKDRVPNSKWNYILGHKIINPKFSDNEVLEKVDRIIPKFLAEPKAQELIKLYEK